MIQFKALDPADYDLIQQAYQALKRGHVPDKRFIAAAARTGEGIITALNIRAYLGRASVCAEPAVLGQALEKGGCFTTLVVVCYPESIVTPCGMCRELLSDYCPNAQIIVSVEGSLQKCAIQNLLPYKFFGMAKNAFIG